MVNGWIPAPWDLAHIEVRRSGGILAVFDEDTSAHATYVMSDLADATAVVRRHFPDWSGRYVAYGTSDTTAIAEMSGMTRRADRAAWRFPCWRARTDRWPPTGSRSTRPSSVTSSPAGSCSATSWRTWRWAPPTTAALVWLMEGAAEYVARSTMPVDDRRRIAAYQSSPRRRRTRLEPTRGVLHRRPHPQLQPGRDGVRLRRRTTRGEGAVGPGACLPHGPLLLASAPRPRASSSVSSGSTGADRAGARLGAGA